jgi:hypothetical protein
MDMSSLSHKSNMRRIQWLSKREKKGTEKNDESGHSISTPGKVVV